MEHYGFVYCWTNLENGMKYIGSHHGKIDDGYVGSSVYFIRSYRKSPELFSREILELNTYGDDPYLTYSLEQKHLDTVPDIHLNEGYYNLSPYAFHPGGWNRGKTGVTQHLQPAKEKISIANKGKLLTEKTRAKISESKLGRNKENDAGRLMTSQKLIGNQNGKNRKNTPAGKTWINKDGVSKMVPAAEIVLYKDWNRGRK